MCTGIPTCALVICGYGTEPWPAAELADPAIRALTFT
jgi:hypothetical protein